MDTNYEVTDDRDIEHVVLAESLVLGNPELSSQSRSTKRSKLKRALRRASKKRRDRK